MSDRRDNVVSNPLPVSFVGFFLHITFRTYELLRALPWREPLLRGSKVLELKHSHIG
jgi:trehalose-6-phosphate synthase